MTRRWTARAGLYLRLLHVEAVAEVLPGVPLDAGHVPALGQPGELGPEGLTASLESNLPVDTVSEAVVLRYLTRTLCCVQLHVLNYLGRRVQNTNLIVTYLQLYCNISHVLLKM